MTNFVRIKICGLTRVEDALRVLDEGADAIGLNFYPKSPRYISVEKAAEIAAAVGPFVSIVGLFVDATEEEVGCILQSVPLHLLQFHGDESPEFCASFKRPYLKALRMKPGLDPSLAIEQYSSASGILLDAYKPGVPGGTGDTFDWARVPQNCPIPLVLAGGLTAENVSDAIAATRIYGVDVSGGVESAPGIKDPEKIRAFIRNARGTAGSNR
jgi:phosphoribosylanthranilate isomerase